MLFSNTGRVQVSTLQVSRPVNTGSVDIWTDARVHGLCSRPVNTGRDSGSVYRALVVERGTAENNEGPKIL